MIREIKFQMRDWCVLTAHPAVSPLAVMYVQGTNLVQVVETSLCPANLEQNALKDIYCVLKKCVQPSDIHKTCKLQTVG